MQFIELSNLLKGLIKGLLFFIFAVDLIGLLEELMKLSFFYIEITNYQINNLLIKLLNLQIHYHRMITY